MRTKHTLYLLPLGFHAPTASTRRARSLSILPSPHPSTRLHACNTGDDIHRVSAHHKTAAQHASDRADALERALSATVRAQTRTRSRLDY